MYPQDELNHLAARKVALLAEIHTGRLRCVAALERAARPFAWLDAAHRLWNRVAPLVSVSLIISRFFRR